MVADYYLTAEDRKRLHQAHNGILAIVPRITNQDLIRTQISEIDLSRTMQELFIDYFKSRQQGQEPNDELMALFREVLAAETDNE